MAENDRIFEYCLSVAREFEARRNRLQAFVKHNLTSGTANESLLRDFLERHCPTQFEVAQGFICDLENDAASRQCDILVHSRAYYPLVYSDGPIRVIYPEAANLTIEVKTMLDKDSLYDAIQNTVSVRKIAWHSLTIVFAFKSLKPETICEHLESYPENADFEGRSCGPTAILLLDQGAVIHNWGWGRSRDVHTGRSDDSSSYALWRADNEPAAFIVAVLFLLFLNTVGRGKIYEANPINSLIMLMEGRATKDIRDWHLGRNSPKASK